MLTYGFVRLTIISYLLISRWIWLNPHFIRLCLSARLAHWRACPLTFELWEPPTFCSLLPATPFTSIGSCARRTKFTGLHLLTEFERLVMIIILRKALCADCQLYWFVAGYVWLHHTMTTWSTMPKLYQLSLSFILEFLQQICVGLHFLYKNRSTL